MTTTSRHHLPVAREPSLAAPSASAPSRMDAALGVGLEEHAGAVDDSRLLQVGDIAKATGKTVRAIHHYEDVGLLQPHARSKGRYRLYDQAALTRVRWIGKLHDLGLSLSEIQNIVSTWESAPSAPGAMAQIRSVYQQKLEEVRGQIARLTTLERELTTSLDYLDTCGSCDPAEIVEACTNCNLHDKSQAEPELVAGIHGGNGHCRNGSAYR
jgi:MerR family transcriptional regulator, copper efflux regulator